jgi:hypothetical protein
VRPLSHLAVSFPVPAKHPVSACLPILTIDLLFYLLLFVLRFSVTPCTSHLPNLVPSSSHLSIIRYSALAVHCSSFANSRYSRELRILDVRS